MHVHLIAIKVCIVRCAHRQIQSEGRVRQNFDSVTHHRHSMQGRLPIKEHKITFLKTPLHNHTGVNFMSNLLFSIIQIKVESLESFLSRFRVSLSDNDELHSILFCETYNLFDVVLCNFLWNG